MQKPILSLYRAHLRAIWKAAEWMERHKAATDALLLLLLGALIVETYVLA